MLAYKMKQGRQHDAKTEACNADHVSIHVKQCTHCIKAYPLPCTLPSFRNSIIQNFQRTTQKQTNLICAQSQKLLLLVNE